MTTMVITGQTDDDLWIVFRYFTVCHWPDQE